MQRRGKRRGVEGLEKRQHIPHASIILIEFVRFISASSPLDPGSAIADNRNQF
jgi:hypothetical protein